MIPTCSRVGTLMLCGLVLFGGLGGHTAQEEPAEDPATQQMDRFTMAGYASDGAKKWELEGTGANLEGSVVTISRPDGIGYDVSDSIPPAPTSALGGPGTQTASSRTAHLTASLAQMEQDSRRVRMEHDVTIHTSDGLWLASPLLYWLPDRQELTTEQPVRLETDHMLLRARGATGHTTLKQAVFLRDIELVLSSESEAGKPMFATGPPGAPTGGARRHVIITCDGPLTFDYTRYIATFTQNVHVKDGDSDLYSDTLVAHLEQRTRAIRYAEALGHVRITQGPHTAHGRRAVYEPRDSRMTLLGAPSLMVYPDAGTPGRGLAETGVFSVSRAPAGPPPAVVKGLHDLGH